MPAAACGSWGTAPAHLVSEIDIHQGLHQPPNTATFSPIYRAADEFSCPSIQFRATGGSSHRRLYHVTVLRNFECNNWVPPERSEFSRSGNERKFNWAARRRADAVRCSVQ